ncbi:hypothetical protein K3495_g12804 [Podosphaera aphanis]|nr:hypothetical protein K3495_g12804 [Podosphaera aphanis]
MSEFETAVADSKKLVSKPNNDELLELYGLYKIATGEDITKAPKPGNFDLKGKAKKRAWQEVVNTGVDEEGAKVKYIKLVEDLKVAYGYDPNKVSETIGGGP